MPFIRSLSAAAVALTAVLPAHGAAATTQWKPEQPINANHQAVAAAMKAAGIDPLGLARNQ